MLYYIIPRWKKTHLTKALRICNHTLILLRKKTYVLILYYVYKIYLLNNQV